MPIFYLVDAGVSHENAFLKQRNRLNLEERGDLQLNSTISSQLRMLLLFLTGNTFLIDGVSNFNEKFAIFLLCLSL